MDTLLQRDPQATWSYGTPVAFGETVMVFCTVNAFGKSMTSQLPVMDYRNKAVPNPDAFAVNTAMQRALTKAIALHGLGLSLYVGEDLWDDIEVDSTKFVEKILGSQDIPELKVNFAQAFKEVSKDKEAMKKVNDAKEKPLRLTRRPAWVKPLSTPSWP